MNAQVRTLLLDSQHQAYFRNERGSQKSSNNLWRLLVSLKSITNDMQDVEFTIENGKL